MEYAIWSLLIVCVTSIAFYVTTNQHIPMESSVVNIPIGSKWALRVINGDPFSSKNKCTVTILDVKDGKVRYFSVDSIFTDECKDIPMFLAIYTKVADAQVNEA